MARRGPRGAALRPRAPLRLRPLRRGRRLHPRRRLRLAGPQARLRRRRPAGRRRRDRRRPAPARQRRREPRPPVGPQGRGRQLRRRHLARVPPLPGDDGLRREPLLPGRASRRRPTPVRPLGRGGAGRNDVDHRVHAPAAGAGPAGRPARQVDDRGAGVPPRSRGRGGGAAAAAARGGRAASRRHLRDHALPGCRGDQRRPGRLAGAVRARRAAERSPRRRDRHARAGRRRGLGLAAADAGDSPPRRRGGPRAGRRQRDQPPRGAVRDAPRIAGGHPRGSRTGQGVHRLGGRGDAAVRNRRHPHQLPRRRRRGGGAGAGGLFGRALAPPGRAEGPVRPGQPLPAQPQHPPSGARHASPAGDGSATGGGR